jgi:hypothetical protein
MRSMAKYKWNFETQTDIETVVCMITVGGNQEFTDTRKLEERLTDEAIRILHKNSVRVVGVLAGERGSGGVPELLSLLFLLKQVWINVAPLLKTWQIARAANFGFSLVKSSMYEKFLRDLKRSHTPYINLYLRVDHGGDVDEWVSLRAGKILHSLDYLADQVGLNLVTTYPSYAINADLYVGYHQVSYGASVEREIGRTPKQLAHLRRTLLAQRSVVKQNVRFQFSSFGLLKRTVSDSSLSNERPKTHTYYTMFSAKTAGDLWRQRPARRS